MSTSASAALAAQVDYIIATTPAEVTAERARQALDEVGVYAPSLLLGQVLATLAATGAHGESAGAVVVSPAAALIGLSMLPALGKRQSLTCVATDADHLNIAKATFKVAGFPTQRARFLTARPLEVMGRLAPHSYHVVFLDLPATEVPAALETALPLLCHGGSIVIARSLLDGTIADPSRRDRETQAMREAETMALELGDDFVVTRQPLEGGITIITHR